MGRGGGGGGGKGGKKKRAWDDDAGLLTRMLDYVLPDFDEWGGMGGAWACTSEMMGLTRLLYMIVMPSTEAVCHNVGYDIYQGWASIKS